MWLRLSVSLLLCGALQAQEQPAMINPPPNAKLLGSSEIAEIRALPEMGLKAKGKPQAATVVGIDGIDRIFETEKSFADTVSFFDQQFKQPGYEIVARVETPSATAWTVKRTDGTIANAAVRNTKPTSFEIAEVQP